MAEIRWTAEAQRWLKDIHDYIALDNSSAAIKVIEAIYQKVQTLNRFPEQGYRYLRYVDKNIRIIIHGHYRVKIESYDPFPGIVERWAYGSDHRPRQYDQSLHLRLICQRHP